MIFSLHGDCRDMLLPYSLTLVTGAFFVLLWLYWLLTFMKRISPSHSIPWFLAMFYAAAIFALAVEIYEQSDLIVHEYLPKKTDLMCSNSTEIHLSSLRTRAACCNDDLWDHRFILRLPLFVLGSMGVLCAVYLCIFLACCACQKKIPDNDNVA